MAERLGVPIYIHPREPSPAMIKPYQTYPALTGSMWGYAAETGLHAMRLICSGVFDKYPGVKIILGHLGEALPFWLWRMDERWKLGEGASDPLVKKLKKRPSDYVRRTFCLLPAVCSGSRHFCAFTLRWEPTAYFLQLTILSNQQ
jgi:predicted TIM-barrel fold metal-dependent hydrolase